jgi:hypothetical protein
VADRHRFLRHLPRGRRTGATSTPGSGSSRRARLSARAHRVPEPHDDQGCRAEDHLDGDRVEGQEHGGSLVYDIEMSKDGEIEQLSPYIKDGVRLGSIGTIDNLIVYWQSAYYHKLCLGEFQARLVQYCHLIQPEDQSHPRSTPGGSPQSRAANLIRHGYPSTGCAAPCST